MIDIGALLRPEIPRLRRYARALMGDATRADDLVEECLRQAVRTIDLFWSGTDLRVWLFAILHDQRVNNRRPMARRLPATAVDAAAEGALVGLQQALARLSDDEREVVLLVGLEGFRYDDAARILDVPVGTVRARLSRGRSTLRVAMTGGERPRSSVAA
jgi:RNA polymerase sigma-70 factor (ECF subfamily)